MTKLRLLPIDDRCCAGWLAARERQKLLLRCTCRATSLIRTLPALEDILTVSGIRLTCPAPPSPHRPSSAICQLWQGVTMLWPRP